MDDATTRAVQPTRMDAAAAGGAGAPPAASSWPTSPLSPDASRWVRSHVRAVPSSSDAPLPPLTGRAHQRFHGGRRLVCGGCCFRVDEVVAEEGPTAAAAAAAASSAAAPSVTPSDVVAASSAAPPAPATSVELSVLLVRSKKRDEWIWPKGGWEKFESSSECAARECLEEGGVEGRLLCALSCVDFSSKKGRASRLQPYLLQATAEHAHWAEEGLRQRRWVRADRVEATLGRPETIAVWADVKEQLRRLGYMDEQGRAQFIEPPLQDAPKELLCGGDIAATDSATSDYEGASPVATTTTATTTTEGECKSSV